MADEEKQEDQAEEQENETVEIPEKYQDLVEQIEELTVLELSELVGILEDHFGVSASAPAVAAAPAAGGGAEEEEEQSSYDVVLKEAGDKKINTIKAVREITKQGLAECKAMVEDAPSTVVEDASKEEANEAKDKLEEAGASVELQ